MADLTLRSIFNRWRDVAWIQRMGGVVVSVACFAVSRETGRAIPGSDYSVTYSDSDSADSDSAMFPKGSPPPPAGREAAPIVAKYAPPKAGRDQVPFKAPPPNLLRPLPPKTPSPPRARLVKPPPPKLQIRRTNSLPTMKSPPMALSIHRRPHQLDLLQYPNGYRHPVVEPPRAPLIPDNPRGDEPEPARLLSRSHSWPVRKEWLTRWPLTLIVFRRSNSDSCLWERSWGEEVD